MKDKKVMVAVNVTNKDREKWKAAKTKAKKQGKLWPYVLMELIQEYLDREDD